MMMDTPTPASVTITQLLITSLPVSGPLLIGMIVQAIITLKNNARARSDAQEAKVTAAAAHVLAASTAKAVDGQMSEFKAALEGKVDLKVRVAELEANKAGVLEGQVKAEQVAAKQAGEVATARALPPDPSVDNKQ